MLKFLIAAAPYLLRAPEKTSQKQIARSFTALVLFALSGMFLSGAAFVYLSEIYGAAVGFLAVSILYFTVGLVLYLKAKRGAQSKTVIESEYETTDPIASLVPANVMSDPAVSKVVTYISKNPVAASVAAASIGMLLSRELFKD